MRREWFKSFSWNSTELVENLSKAWGRGENIALFNPALLKLNHNSFVKQVDKALDETEGLKLQGERKIVLCTSGTEGYPKFVLHTETTVKFNIRLLREHLKIDEGYQFIGSVPLFHAFGLNLTFLNALEGGDYLHMDKGDWSEMILHMEEARRLGKKVFLPLVPQMIKNMPDNLFSEAQGVSVTGGDVLSSECFARLKNIFPNIAHTIGYGMTEAGPVISHTDILDGLDRDGLIGCVLPPIKYKIIEGTLHFKSPGQALYEYKNSMWHCLNKSWIDTGDIVESSLDKLYFLGRKKNVLKINSEAIFPEQVLLEIKRSLNLDSPMKLDVVDDRLILFIADLSCESRIPLFLERLQKLPRIYRPEKIVLTTSIGLNALGKTTNLVA